MIRSIKRSLKYLIILTGIVITLPTVFAIVISIPQVQTYIVKRITGHFSQEFQSVISVGKVKFSFPNKLNMNDILIKDRNSDTLIHCQSLTAGIRRINLNESRIALGKVVAVKPYFALITDTSGILNLNWYLDLIRKPRDTAKTAQTAFSINQIDLSNARFALINRGSKETRTPIDFNNLHLYSINGIVEDFRIFGDSISFSVYNLGFRESTGFNLKKMNSDVTIANGDIVFNSSSLLCDTSILNIPHLGLIADSFALYKDFTEQVKLDLLLNRSLIGSTDLQYFIFPLKGMNEFVWLSGKTSGTISELRGRNIELSYRESTYIDCDFDFSGLPEIGNTFMYIGVNDLITNSDDLERLRFTAGSDFKIPGIFHKLGTVSFDGSFTGFTTDFVTYGEIRTEIGTLSTDLSLRPEGTNRFKLKGMLKGSSIDLGSVTERPELFGNISMTSDIDGYSYALKNFSGNLTGKIDSIEFNNYKYRNIELSGLFNEDTWDGSIEMTDDNIKLELLGMLNFSREMPEFDFTMNLAEADLHKLNLDRADSTASLSMLMTANFKGNNIDNIDGEIKILNSSYRRQGNILELYDISLRTFNENNLPAISLRTDFVDAELRGRYNFAQLNTMIKVTLSNLMPSRFRVPTELILPDKNNFTFNITFKNTDRINNFFQTRLLVADKSTIRGTVIADSLISVTGNAGSVNFGANILKDLNIDARILLPELKFDLKSSSFNLLGQSELKNFSIAVNTIPDSFIFRMNWDNREKIPNRGNFTARGAFLPDTSGKWQPVLMVSIDSTSLYSGNNLWKINNSSILLDTNSIKIDRFYLSSNDRFYLVDGSVSENPSDTLHLEFKGIDISPVNYLITRNSNPEMISLELKGVLDGRLILTDYYRNPLVETDLMIDDFSILGSNLGSLSVTSTWDNVKKVAEINARNSLEGKKMIDITGSYDPASKRMNLVAGAEKLPILALNPLLSSFASGITGMASGRVSLTGELKNLVLKGSLMAENASLKIDYLQTRYRMNDSIRFDKNEIRFRNIRFYDERGNTANLNGSVYHTHFNDFNVNLMISANECMVLNTKPKDNEMFYGTAFATGVATIKSTPDLMSFDISARTGRNTKFFMPLTYTETVSDYSYITFIDPDSISIQKERAVKKTPAPVTAMGLDITVDLEVTPDAELQLIFDSKIGDVIKSHGSGNLNIHLDPKGNIWISGDYNIEDGDYLFTLGNIFNKHFTVESGGKITFDGDVDNAEIDMRAIYKLRTSLSEIFSELGDERIQVDCQLNLSGKLFSPVVGLNIDLPQADEQTRSFLKSKITTQEELSRQFLYLLVMNSFYSDSYENKINTIRTSPTATTTEMLSNQLSNWLSQISKDFDVGFVYRYGSPENPNLQEVQVALSTQVLNDRVTINGNFDVGNQVKENPQKYEIPDVDIEYRITEKIRFKVFNRFNNLYSGGAIKGSYTQGFGFLFKQDFDRFSDLFRKKEKSEMKKEDSPEVSEN
ncbi:MAG: translocation/assembly module TamB domain-containing protein [Bacteroidales bacterium]|nr:translocation/assembly module TamB domain-containing protein [Bacteroidales bacterium]